MSLKLKFVTVERFRKEIDGYEFDEKRLMLMIKIKVRCENKSKLKREVIKVDIKTSIFGGNNNTGFHKNHITNGKGSWKWRNSQKDRKIKINERDKSMGNINNMWNLPIYS